MAVTIANETGFKRITIPAGPWKSSMTAAILAELESAVTCVLIEAEGPVFCGEGFEEMPPGVFRFREWITHPVVCAVQGAVLGPGVGLIANAHVVVAAQGTSFGLTEVRTGGWPAAMPALQRAIGERRAVELALTGRVFGAPEALQIGLVHELAPAFEFDDRAEAIARHLGGLKLEGRLPAKFT
jgi:enoyl-CoA hydratase/carnithine racemase